MMEVAPNHYRLDTRSISQVNGKYLLDWPKNYCGQQTMRGSYHKAG